MQKNPEGQAYDTLGAGYTGTRRADPRIERVIWAALGDARSVINVGGGSGNYEPTDRRMVAVDPSMAMLAQRPAGGLSAIQGVAEALPFRDKSFDAAMATLTLHHWTNFAGGLTELRRVSRRQVVFQYDPEVNRRFWLINYFPEILGLPTEIRAPTIADIQARLQVERVTPVPIPADCTDGFLGAYWRRPEMYLQSSVRAGISGLAQLPLDVQTRGANRLEQDLDSGTWDIRYGHLRKMSELDIGYRLIVAGN